MKNFMKIGIIGAVASLSLVACEKEQSITAVDSTSQSAANARRGYDDATFYALSDGTTLDKLSTKKNDRESSSVPITGLQSGEKILAIDFRPATGQLYGLGSTSRLYVINPITGVARTIGAGAFTPALSGNIVGFDFNPTVDRIRLVTNTGQNLRLNPETGVVVMADGAINGQNGVGIAAVAYTNNFAGATATTLYDIDPVTDRLFKQDPPNNGTLVEVGSLRLDITGEGGFDIMTDEENGLALFEVDGKSTLFSVDLQSGRAQVLNKYDKKYTALAIPTRPVAYAVDGSNNLLIFEPTAATGNDKNYLISISLNIGLLGKNNNKENEIISKPLTGLHPGEKVLGIDFRPLNGQLYALGSTGTIYTVNTASGQVTSAGKLNVQLEGTQFGFDFNPVVDRIRIVSDAGQNLRFNPNDGSVIIDGKLNPATTGVTAAAYANNFAGTTTTTLFDIDVNSDKLFVQNPPNSGTLVEQGSLGVNVDAANGFDIGGTSGIAYALLTSDGKTKLYVINTTTGEAKSVGKFPTAVNGFAIGLGF